jgi:hypothetical protein
MTGSELEGLSIPIVEDELLVAMDIADAFESVGAVTAMATTLQQALILVEEESPKAAVVDHVLGPEDSCPYVPGSTNKFMKLRKRSWRRRHREVQVDPSSCRRQRGS